MITTEELLREMVEALETQRSLLWGNNALRTTQKHFCKGQINCLERVIDRISKTKINLLPPEIY